MHQRPAMLNDVIRRPGQPQTQTRRKLRDSCTDCASSKVRCSKDKPTCTRCARRGVTCVYMVSRRTGRTSSNASKGDTMARIWGGSAGGGPPTGTTGIPDSTRGLDATARSRAPDGVDGMETADAHRHWAANPLLTHSTTSPTGNLGHPTPDPETGPGTLIALDADLWAGAMLTPSALISDPTALSPPPTAVDTDVGDPFDMGLQSPMLLDGPDHPPTTTYLFDTIPLSLSEADFLPSTDSDRDPAPIFALDWALPTTTAATTTPPSPTNPHPPTPNPPTSCLTTVLSILARLFPHSEGSCTLASPEAGARPPSTAAGAGAGAGAGAAAAAARTIDAVVADNKHILASLARLLDCPCAQDEYLVSLLTLVLIKVMGWYAAAAGGCSYAGADCGGGVGSSGEGPGMGWGVAGSGFGEEGGGKAGGVVHAGYAETREGVAGGGGWSGAGQAWAGGVAGASSGSGSGSGSSASASASASASVATSTTTSPPDSWRPSSSVSSVSGAVSCLGHGAGIGPAPGGSVNANPLAELVLRAPATVGNYRVAGQHRERMAAQLVLSELHRVQGLVNALSRRLTSIRERVETGAGKPASGSEGSCVGGGERSEVRGGGRTPPLSAPTIGKLEEDLRMRLKVLSSETIGVLKRA